MHDKQVLLHLCMTTISFNYLEITNLLPFHNLIQCKGALSLIEVTVFSTVHLSTYSITVGSDVS